jgi:hypothetical protein
VTLGLVNSKNNNQLSVMAWYSNNLRRYDKSLKNLNDALRKSAKAALIELSFVNENKTVMLVQRVGEAKSKHLEYTFFDVETGSIQYKVDNAPESQMHEEWGQFIGLLVRERDDYKDDPFNHEDEET